MPQRTPTSAPFERALANINEKFDAEIGKIQTRIDLVETRIAQGQHDSTAEIQSMFTELRVVLGDTRDAVSALSGKVSQLGSWKEGVERKEAIDAGVKAELQHRDQHDAKTATAGGKEAVRIATWKPPSWTTVGIIAATGSVVTVLANLHTAMVMAGKLLSGLWQAITGP